VSVDTDHITSIINIVTPSVIVILLFYGIISALGLLQNGMLHTASA